MCREIKLSSIRPSRLAMLLRAIQISRALILEIQRWRTSVEHLLRVFTLAGAFIAVSLGTVNANTIVVNTFADGIDPFGCTIRRAIENHNAKGQPNKQCEPGSGDDLISVKPEVMNLGDPLPPISGNLTIRRLDKCGNL